MSTSPLHLTAGPTSLGVYGAGVPRLMTTAVAAQLVDAVTVQAAGPIAAQSLARLVATTGAPTSVLGAPPTLAMADSQAPVPDESRAASPAVVADTRSKILVENGVQLMANILLELLPSMPQEQLVPLARQFTAWILGGELQSFLQNLAKILSNQIDAQMIPVVAQNIVQAVANGDQASFEQTFPMIRALIQQLRSAKTMLDEASAAEELAQLERQKTLKLEPESTGVFHHEFEDGRRIEVRIENGVNDIGRNVNGARLFLTFVGFAPQQLEAYLQEAQMNGHFKQANTPIIGFQAEPKRVNPPVFSTVIHFYRVSDPNQDQVVPFEFRFENKIYPIEVGIANQPYSIGFSKNKEFKR